MTTTRLLTRFTIIASAVIVLEAILGSWPVVATSIWGSHAVDTWIHFLYWIKMVFLLLAVLQFRWAPQRFAVGAGPYRQLGYLQLCMGATASCELSTWILLSIIAHALLSTIVLLLVLVLQNEFESNTQWILSVVFDAVAIAESVGSPLIVTSFGLGPIMELHPTVFVRKDSLPTRAPLSPPLSSPPPPLIFTTEQTGAGFLVTQHPLPRRERVPRSVSRNPYGV